MLMRSSPEGYSGVTEGNIFSIGQLPHALFILLHGHLTYTCKTNYFLIFHDRCSTGHQFEYFAQILVQEQLTIARCYGVKYVSKSGTRNMQIAGQQSKISHVKFTQEPCNNPDYHHQ